MNEVALNGKRILVAPLDWGLGHAARCMPIIQQLLHSGAEVILGGEGRSLCLLQSAYPNLETIDLPAYNIRYSNNAFMVLKTLSQTPRLLRVFNKEHLLLESLVDKYNIDAVLSDNRYGLWTEKVPTVFMCHQLALMMPAGFAWMRKSVYKAHLKYISKFDHLWIPDLPGSLNLSGSLSHLYDLPQFARFVGPLSRFAGMSSASITQPGHVLILLSGPEPQRTILENLVITQARSLNYSFTIVRGITEQQHITRDQNFTIYNYLDGKELMDEICRAEVVIARPGYSTVMDLSVQQKKALFIPTPGQTEQEYLAKELSKGSFTVIQHQNELDIRQGIFEALELKGVPGIRFEQEYLLKAIKEWLNIS